MNVWLIKEGEPLPLEPSAKRMRTGLMASELAREGHTVTWWSSTYSHSQKRYLRNGESCEVVEGGIVLRLLHSTVAYNRNISFARVLYHINLGRGFARATAEAPSPDIILCSYPSIDLAYEAVRYAREHRVPVVLDIRDHWPDIFLRGVPRHLHWLTRPVISFMDKRAKYALRHATSLVAITQASLDWALSKAGVVQREHDRVIPLGAEDLTLDHEDDADAKRFWEDFGVTPETWNICFFGTLSQSSMDFTTALEAVRQLHTAYPQVRLILCGTGDAAAELSRHSNLSFLRLPGWINRNQLSYLMRLSNVGLYPLRNHPDFRDTISNKFVEYMSGGLPIVTSLEGAAREYIEENSVGTGYIEGSAESLRLALDTLLTDDVNCRGMGRRARACYERDFDAAQVYALAVDHLLRIHLGR